MTNYDFLQILPKNKMAEYLVSFALLCQSEDDKFFDVGIVSQEKIEKWLEADIKGDPPPWEKEYISTLDITPAVYESLFTRGIRTLGDLARLRAYDLKDIPKIGEKGVEQIVTSFMKVTGARIRP